MTARPINPGAEAHLSVRHAVEHIGAITLRDYCGTDAAISRAARVSYGRESADRGADADAKLINYLMRHGHTSPLEMAELVFQVEAPIFVARQWLRHRTASVNERSLRYTEPSADAEIMPAAGAVSAPLGSGCPSGEKPSSAMGLMSFNSAWSLPLFLDRGTSLPS